jgi:Ca2+-binding EF-hand superfamily protein
MSRTSDVVGSFHNGTPEACTSLIRRKIQERCGNTQELMSTIRRLKTGNTGHVTPNEFRLTLLKFGIVVPPHQLEQIFNLFDSDRSGTIDFDEFAMWIMNSEFRPISIIHGGGGRAGGLPHSEDPTAPLRSKLKNCFNDFPKEFSSLRNQIDFQEFLSHCHNKHIPLTDPEIRQIFRLLDPSNSGLIDANQLRQFAFQKQLQQQHPPVSPPPVSTPPTTTIPSPKPIPTRAPSQPIFLPSASSSSPSGSPGQRNASPLNPYKVTSAPSPFSPSPFPDLLPPLLHDLRQSQPKCPRRHETELRETRHCLPIC